MDRSTPVRKSHTNTADLLTWQEVPPSSDPSDHSSSTPLNRRPHQPSEAIRKVVFGGQLTEEEAENLNKRKPCSAPKWKEMTGSGIFAPGSEGLEEEAASVTPVKAVSRAYQQTLSGISQISFSAEEDNMSPKKPSSIAEVAKQRELSGTLVSDADAKMQRQVSDAKRKEISGHDIFAPPEELRPRNTDDGPTTPRGLHSTSAGGASSFLFGEDTDSSLKTAKKIPTRKFTDLTGNDIFKGDNTPSTAEKSLSNAKLKEMTGSDIFADGKADSRHYLGGARKPPGGHSSIALV